MNVCIFIGEVCSPPEYNAEGRSPRCNLRVKTTRNFTDRDGQAQTYHDYIPMVAWGKLADTAHTLIRYGDWVSAQGSYSTRKHEDKTFTNINLDKIEVVQGLAPARQDFAAGPHATTQEVEQDELPF